MSASATQGGHNNASYTVTALQPLYRTPCVCQHHKLGTGQFCWSKV